MYICNHRYYQEGEDDYGYQYCPKQTQVKLRHYHLKQIDQDLSRIWERCFQKQTDWKVWMISIPRVMLEYLYLIALNKNLKQAPRILSPPNVFFHAKFIDELFTSFLQCKGNHSTLQQHYKRRTTLKLFASWRRFSVSPNSLTCNHIMFY